MSASTWVTPVLEVALSNSAAGGSFSDTIVKFFKDGGPFMFVNIFWFACAIAVIIERIVSLMFRYNLNAGPFMEQVTKLVLTGNCKSDSEKCGAGGRWVVRVSTPTRGAVVPRWSAGQPRIEHMRLIINRVKAALTRSKSRSKLRKLLSVRISQRITNPLLG